jgi:hypothetical protein
LWLIIVPVSFSVFFPCEFSVTKNAGPSLLIAL